MIRGFELRHKPHAVYRIQYVEVWEVLFGATYLVFVFVAVIFVVNFVLNVAFMVSMFFCFFLSWLQTMIEKRSPKNVS